MHRYAIGAALALTVALGACGSSSSKSSTSSAPTTAAGGSPSSSAPAAAAASGATVSVANSGSVGQYLVGPNGNTLYLFEKDQGTTTACTGACVSNWPGLAASGTPTAGAGGGMAKLSTAKGEGPHQGVYNRPPLVFLPGDKA